MTLNESPLLFGLQIPIGNGDMIVNALKEPLSLLKQNIKATIPLEFYHPHRMSFSKSAMINLLG